MKTVIIINNINLTAHAYTKCLDKLDDIVSKIRSSGGVVCKGTRIRIEELTVSIIDIGFDYEDGNLIENIYVHLE